VSNKILCHCFGGKFSLVTTDRVICYSQSREVAEAALQELGESFDVLDTEADLAEFRAAWAAAVSNSLGELRGQAAEFLPATDGEKLAERIDELASVIEQQQAWFAEQERLEWERQRPERIEAEIQRRVAHVRNQGIRVDNIGQNIIRAIVEREVE